MLRLRERYGDSFTVKIANEGTWVFVTDPAHVREVFTGDPKLLHAGEGNRVLRPFLGHRSVLLLDDDEHLRSRKALLPPFHGERLARWEDVMREVAEAEASQWTRGAPLNVWPRMQEVTLEVVMRTIFGVRDPGRLETLRARLQAMLADTTQPRRLVTLAAIGPDRAERMGLFSRVIAPVDEALREEIRLARLAPGLAEREDVLAMLAATDMDETELRDQLVTLLIAGHETTATALAWAVERLVRTPGAWERLGDDAYADAVVKETLRLKPVLPVVARRLTAPASIAGMDLPAGVTITPCIYLMHRRAEIYPEPEAFRPERFLETPAGTYTWIPFGGGVRRCLGASFALMEMRIVLQAVARAVTLRPVRPRGERVTRRAITLGPEHGAEVLVA